MATTSHFIIHLTKGAKGYELVKTIYNDFANVGTVLMVFILILSIREL